MSKMEIPEVDSQLQLSPIQEKEEILKEIVRECEEIERRSSNSGSPNSSILSESDSPDIPSFFPYKTPERKERKKAQNRKAATRYREKKRLEKEKTMAVINRLSEKNKLLRTNIDDLEKEIFYIKKIMKDVGIKIQNKY